ncbi:MAG TPA: FHA domain-containing protein [Acidimicrobiales bacterium]|nr:FHA domain-containing protein [Acidimicrobiales bacterium]
MPESLLTILKFFFLALLWLFFARVLWAVWAEVNAPSAAPLPPASRYGGVAAPAAAPARAGSVESTRLRVVEPADRRGTSYDLGDELTVGRASGCQVALPDDSYASQLHARIFRKDGRLWLEDLGSTNGTYLNAKAVTSPVALRRGDRVQVGRTVLEVTR